MEQGPFQFEKMESAKDKSWRIPVEGFQPHVATNASLLGTAGHWGGCNCIVTKNWEFWMGDTVR